MTADFADDWARLVGSTGPLAHHLRKGGKRPWIRFHALPFSKRYAETAEEKKIVLDRANELASEVLGQKSDCWLVECRQPFPHRLNASDVKGTPASIVAEPDEDYEWTAYVYPTRWRAGSFRQLLWQIANDRTGPTLWINRANGAIFAPYDGGFDLFPASQQHLEILRQRHFGWLSEQPDGL